jgi:uncharacterized protein
MTEGPKNMTKQQVLDYLRAHPTLLSEVALEQPELLDALSRPNLAGDDAIVDFQQHRIEALSKALDQHTGMRDDLIDTSRSNMQTQLQVHETVIEIIACRNLESLIGYISRDISHTLRLDAVILCVEPKGDRPFPVREPIMSVKPGSISAAFSDGSTILLGEPTSATRPFFGPAASLVQSQALILLQVPGAPTPVMLAMGDRTPDYFHQGQATHLLRFLGDVLATRLGQFMADSNANEAAQWSSPDAP